MVESTPEFHRLRQGLNYRFQEHEIGVMNVYETDGSPIAQLSLVDQGDAADERVRRGDGFAVGSHTYRVIDVVLSDGDQRGFVDVLPVRVRRWWRRRR